jgi:UDP-N-acetylmuramyl pentapeptide phosphotransferase/UDP-N-acetylglucosamine-1-phosphate transferase
MLVHQLIWLAMLSLAASFFVSLLIVGSQKWHGKLSHDHDLDGVQKVHTTAVPRIGGIAVIAGIALGLLLFARLFPAEMNPSQAMRMALVLAASLPAFFAGIIEDVTKKVPVRVRLVATVGSALLASAAVGATVNDLDIWGVDQLLTIAPFAIAVTATVVAGGCNAINIIDGFNGLSGSSVVIMAAGLSAVALNSGDVYVAMSGALCVGATLGFLLWNYPTGKLFLGDGGAYFLGFWVAEMAVLLLVRNPAVSAWQVLAICAYPVIEVLFSIYRRKFIKKVSPGAPDALHLHALIFRRLVFKHVRPDAARPWKRNAAVTCFVAPIVAMCVFVSVQRGTSTPVSIGLVTAQLVLYILAYGRLVRGRWTRGNFSLNTGTVSGETELR